MAARGRTRKLIDGSGYSQLGEAVRRPRYGAHTPSLTDRRGDQGKLAADLHSRIDTSSVRGVGDTEVRWAPMSGSYKSVPVFAWRSRDFADL
jgi:hypothetical protein